MQSRTKNWTQTTLGLAQVVLFFHFGCVVSQRFGILVQFIISASCSARRSVCWLRCSEHLLRGVSDVEEAVSISVAGVNLPHAWGHAGHALLCHQEKQSLAGVQSYLVPKIKKGEKKTIGAVDKLWKTIDIRTKEAKVWGRQRCGETEGEQRQIWQFREESGDKKERKSDTSWLKKREEAMTHTVHRSAQCRCLFTWAGRGTDPRWAQREPGTLFCPTGGESFHGCNVQQSPESKNTSAISCWCKHKQHKSGNMALNAFNFVK